MKQRKLSDIYKESAGFGTIKITKDGLCIDGKLIKNFVPESLSIKKMGDKTLVNCELICDEFISIPD